MDYEEIARKTGWKPEDQYTGPPGTWKTAEEYVKTGEEIARVKGDEAKSLRYEIDGLKSELSQIRSDSLEFKKIADQAIQRSKQERDAAISELQKVRAKAITDGDGEKVIQAENEIKKLEAEEKPAEDPQKGWNDNAVRWAKENPWYVMGSKDFDEERRIYADGLSDIIVAELPHLKSDPQGYFKELSRRVEERFSETNENRQKETVDAGGKKERKTSNGRSFDDLPDYAKEGFESMKRLIPGLTEEDYLSNYNWE